VDPVIAATIRHLLQDQEDPPMTEPETDDRESDRESRRSPYEVTFTDGVQTSKALLRTTPIGSPGVAR
jgi:hypothetical protein